MTLDARTAAVEWAGGYREGFAQGFDKGYELGKTAALAVLRGEVAGLPADPKEGDDGPRG